MATLAAAGGAGCGTCGALALVEASDGDEDSNPTL